MTRKRSSEASVLQAESSPQKARKRDRASSSHSSKPLKAAPPGTPPTPLQKVSEAAPPAAPVVPDEELANYFKSPVVPLVTATRRVSDQLAKVREILARDFPSDAPTIGTLRRLLAFLSQASDGISEAEKSAIKAIARLLTEVEGKFELGRGHITRSKKELARHAELGRDHITRGKKH